jgi:outer membrane protein OmpA-like peptidoglycan-associated protein
MEAGREAEAARRELEAQRARADSLERARRAEMDARADAEARAEEAASAARAAEARAADAEARLAEAFAELDRILIDVAGVTETERGLVVTLGSGTFASGQASLTARSRSEVGRIARVLQEFPDRDILIEGHTDAVGEEAANQALSERRADAVRAALIADGVSPRRITALGSGESRPISDNDTPAGRAENRRVEIVVLEG